MNIKKSLVYFCFSCLIATSANAQNKTIASPTFDKVAIGFGLGMDYGGIGANVAMYPTPNFGIFGGAGYAFAGLGYNIGMKVRTLPKTPYNTTCFYGMAMYGYNAAIAISNSSNLDRIFYGPTLGFGFDYRARPYEANNYWSFALLIPIRNSEAQNYISNLERSGVKFNTPLLPIAISVGYHFGN